MPPLAAIHNFGPKDGDDIQVFYSQQNGNVAMVLKSGTGATDSNFIYAAGASAQKGYEINPSQIAACKLHGFNLVVGLTTNPSSSSATNDVSMLCPIYKPLGASTVGNASIAACSSGSNATIFFLTGNSSKTIISAYDFDSDSSTDFKNTPPVRPGTSLAAYYDEAKNERWFIFQGADDPNLVEYCIDRKATNTLDNTGDANAGTPMAATVTNGIVCLYYSNSNASPAVRCIYKKGGEWGQSTGPKGNTDSVSPDSQITVTSVEDTNFVYWSKNKSSSTVFSRYKDLIPSK